MPIDRPLVHELPGRYQQTVLNQMLSPHAEADALILATIQFQTTLSCWARSIFTFTNMAAISHNRLTLFQPEADNVVFRRFDTPDPFDVFELFYDVTQYVMQDADTNWNFVEIPHLDSAFLDHDTQYLGIRPADHISFIEQDALCLIEIHLDEQRQGAATFNEVQFSSRYLPMRLDELELYNMIGFHEVCLQEECRSKVNGIFIQRGQDIHLIEGSFICVYIGEEDRQMSPFLLDQTDEDAEMIQHPEDPLPTSSSPTFRSTTGDGHSSSLHCSTMSFRMALAPLWALRKSSRFMSSFVMCVACSLMLPTHSIFLSIVLEKPFIQGPLFGLEPPTQGASTISWRHTMTCQLEFGVSAKLMQLFRINVTTS